MKLLLTSAGVKNASIHKALVDLLGKPIAESTAPCIPTATCGHPMLGCGNSAVDVVSEGQWRVFPLDIERTADPLIYGGP